MRMRRASGRLVLAAALLATPGCSSLNARKHPAFKARHPQLHTLAILPPQVEAYKVTFKGEHQMMFDLLPAVEQQALEEVERALVKRGYTVTRVAKSDPMFAEQPEVKTSLNTLRELLEKRVKEYQKKWFGVFRTFDYTLGSEINLLADATGSDALVMVRCSGFKKTSGEVAQDLAKTALIFAATLGTAFVYEAPSVTLIQIALVDGNTGDLLWYVDNMQERGGWGPTGFDISNERQFRRTLFGMATHLPKSRPDPVAAQPSAAAAAAPAE